MIDRFSYPLTKWLIRALVGLIVLLAVLVGLGRELLSNIHYFENHVIVFLRNYTGYEVHFDSIEGSWSRLGPGITLEQLSLSSSNTLPAFFTARNASLRLDLAKSFLKMQPRLVLRIDGAFFGLVVEEGRLNIQGLQLDPNPADRKKQDITQLLDQWLNQPLVAVENSNILIKGVWPDQVRANNLKAKLFKRKYDKRLVGEFSLNGNSPVSVNFDLIQNGRFSEPDSIGGRLYLNVQADALQDWVPVVLQEHFKERLIKGKGELALWARMRHGKPERMTADVRLVDLKINNAEGEPLPIIDKLESRLRWQGDLKQSWQLSAHDTQWVWQGVHWNPKRLALEYRHEQELQQYTAVVDKAQIKPWADFLVAVTEAGSGLHDYLEALQVEGTLQDFSLRVRLPEQNDLEFEAQGTVFNVVNQPKGWIPGFKGLGLDFYLSSQESFFRIDDHPIKLDYPRLFRDELDVKHLSGALSLEHNDHGFLAKSGLLSLANDDIRGACQLSVRIPSADVSPYLQLQAVLRDLDAAKTSHYLPAGIIPGGLLKWLDNGIVGGKLLRGDLLFHGPTRLHEDNEQFQYILGFMATDAEINFLPDWPNIQQAAADVQVYSGDVLAEIEEGKYYGARIDYGTVVRPLPDTAGEDEPLQIDVKLEGELENAFKVLTDSPLTPRLGSVIHQIRLGGFGKLDLSLQVPLSARKQSMEVDVGAHINRGEFSLAESGLTIHNLSGLVNFNLRDGLSSPGLTGELFGGPLSVTIESESLADQSVHTQINTQGRTPLQPIQQWLKIPLLSQLSGELVHNTQVHFYQSLSPSDKAMGQHYPYVEMFSSLEGVAADLPYPFGKKADEKSNFHLVSSLQGEEKQLHIEYQDLLTLDLNLQGGSLKQGALVFGKQDGVDHASDAESATSDSENEQQWMTVTGHLPEVRLQEWLQLKAALTQESAQRVQEESTPLVKKLNDCRVKVDRVLFGDHDLGEVVLFLRQSDDDWIFEAEGERVDLSLSVPHELYGKSRYMATDPPLDVMIRHLSLEKADSEQVFTEKQEQDHSQAVAVDQFKTGIDPQILPPIRFDLSHLEYEGQEFGSWRALITPAPGGVRMETLEFDLRHVRFKGAGHWVEGVEDFATQIKGVATAGDIAKVISAWGYQPTLESKKARVDIEAAWRGAPYQFDLAQAYAKARIKVEDGKFLSISSGAADKVLGVLNFERWLDLLRLQFKDLSSDEMTFSAISGNFELVDNVLSVGKLNLESPAIEMLLAGDLNLASRDLDFDLDVTIPVTRNLVLPAAAVGGIAAAATVFVIEKVLGDQLNKLTTMKYRIGGVLGQPEVTLKESFNILPKQLEQSIVTEPNHKSRAGSGGQSQPGTPQEQEATTTGAEPTKPLAIPGADSGDAEPEEHVDSTVLEQTLPKGSSLNLEN